MAVIAITLALACVAFSAVAVIMNVKAPDESEDKPPIDDDAPTDGSEHPEKPEDPKEPEVPKKKVAITLDDGPHPDYQKKFVDEMKKYGGAATFFVVGDRVETWQSTGQGLAYAVENGWEIGIHAWTHKYYFNSCSDDIYNAEISKTLAVIQKYIPGYDVKVMRPPGGSISNSRVGSSDFAIVLWDVDSNDWQFTGTSAEKQQENVDLIVANVIASVKDGSIILMHELYENSYLAFCEILRQLDEQGYEFVTVTELLGDKYQTGKKFWSGR